MRNLMFLALGLCLGMYISRLKVDAAVAVNAATAAQRTPAP